MTILVWVHESTSGRSQEFGESFRGLKILSGFYMLHRSLLVLLYFSNLHFKYFFMDLGIRLPDESRKNVPFHINASSKDIKP